MILHGNWLFQNATTQILLSAPRKIYFNDREVSFRNCLIFSVCFRVSVRLAYLGHRCIHNISLSLILHFWMRAFQATCVQNPLEILTYEMQPLVKRRLGLSCLSSANIWLRHQFKSGLCLLWFFLAQCQLGSISFWSAFCGFSLWSAKNQS